MNSMAVRTQTFVEKCWQWTHLRELTDRSGSTSSAILVRESGELLWSDIRNERDLSLIQISSVN